MRIRGNLSFLPASSVVSARDVHPKLTVLVSLTSEPLCENSLSGRGFVSILGSNGPVHISASGHTIKYARQRNARVEISH